MAIKRPALSLALGVVFFSMLLVSVLSASTLHAPPLVPLPRFRRLLRHYSTC
jgi:hypothetical protein